MDVTFIQPGSIALPAPGGSLRATSADNPVSKPDIVSRTEWGCPDGQASRWQPVDTDVEFLIVHHSAGSNTASDWVATVQSIWSFHTLTRGWGDIGYNFLIDPDGVIYEGRAGGDSIGAHFSCTNGGTMGVCLIGDFTAQNPSSAALDSLEQLLAWKSDAESIDPLMQAYHTQSGLTLDRISGHRDGNAGDQGCPSGTVCPGAMLYPLLPDIRARVASIIGASTPDFTLVNLAVSPNRIDAGSTMTIAYQMVADRAFLATFELALIDSNGIEQFASFASAVSVGKQTKNRGVLVPPEILPGIYALQVRISDGDTPISEHVFPELLSVLPPAFSRWASSRISDPSQRAPFSDPEGDGLSNLIEYAFMLDPTLPDRSPVEFLWVQEDSGRYPALRFSQRAGMNLRVTLQRFGSGAWIESGIEVASAPLGAATRRTIRSTSSEASNSEQLLRLKLHAW
jgi:hypothetical protein